MYLDASVVVKLYTNERDSGECEASVEGNTLVSSRLLLCEFRSAVLRKISLGLISQALGAEVWQEFNKDIAALKVNLVPVSDFLVHDAAELIDHLCPKVPLRTLDALHLATYLSVEAGPFFTKDARLRQAAVHLGVDLAN
jgi:predicted nucleic acid-binding protein